MVKAVNGTWCPRGVGWGSLPRCIVSLEPYSKVKTRYSLSCKQTLFMAVSLLICGMFFIVHMYMYFLSSHRLVPVFKALFMTRLF